MLSDTLARCGVLTEAGPGRHGVGSNFQMPGGNHHELPTEMPWVPHH